MGVGDGHAHEDLEDGGGGLVAEAASGGNIRLVEIPAAQNGVAGFQHVLTAGPGIGGMVLVVAVYGDDAIAIGPVFQEPAEGILQGRALAFVHFMVKQMDLRVLGSQIGKIMKIFLLASVVDQDDIGEAVFQQAVDDGDELLIRI